MQLKRSARKCVRRSDDLLCFYFRLDEKVARVFLSQSCKAPAKQSQHLKATYRNIVGRSMLYTIGYPVATCCDMLRHIGCSWLKFEAPAKRSQHLNTTYTNIVGPALTSSSQTIATIARNISQHCWAQYVACVGPPCCDVDRWPLF